jgi:hypothetical protein
MNLDDLDERNYYDGLLGKGAGDPDNIRWVGRDKAMVQLRTESGIHWSERAAMGYVAQPLSPREFGDNDKSDPEMNLEEK